MTEMSSGLRALEMQERQTWHRERAQREHVGAAVDRPRRRMFPSRAARRTA
ncbi:MAG: hypothetical protein JWM02_1702 [Frankiales bacterium]|nr:hypothetical protein [Frankiales bacterium]